MSVEITVNTAMLSADIEGLSAELGMIQKDLDSMYEAVAVLDSMWEGLANEVFVKQFRKDKEEMVALCRTIQKLINCMNNARQEYDTCENEIHGIISSIPI